MSKIVCKLFGVPQITEDGQSVFLPYAKINALLYYLMVTKVASRDEIAGLLWPDEDGTIARKNIRNAIYPVSYTHLSVPRVSCTASPSTSTRATAPRVRRSRS